ncbi:NADP-dependent oxidoreductase [Deinococcus phoenicis]|uniref:NADP-dependent oxidoreductase n=1 Tax=Deinococcus phoenicis TaxID=1476583 RepID=UPI0004B23AF6|nr:NADP-dependent oxidoreductase [Deinococcus phoenicis]
MKAASIERYGPNDVVQIGFLPQPRPGPYDLLVRVRAASVNPIDLAIRGGRLRPILPYKLPLILGSDLSGEVVAVGSAVTRFAVGDEVFARLDKDRIGAFAEYALVGEKEAALKPARLTHVQAASIPLVGLTAWQALTELGQVRRGQKVLIQAGSGGVGSIAIQLARSLGAEVATTVSARNEALVRELGAQTVIDYRTQQFDDVLSDQDFVLDTQGGDVLARSFKVLRWGGTLVTINGTPTPHAVHGRKLTWPVRLALTAAHLKDYRLARRYHVKFAYLFMRPDGQQLEVLGDMLQGGTIRPVIDRVFALDEVREALAYSETGRATGKVVIEVP